VTKTGTSAWTLAGNNTYGGATTVNGGTLIVTGSISGTSAISVSGSATLELAANNALSASARLTLSNGILQTLSSQTEALSDLTVLTGSSTIALGNTGSIMNFADSSGDAWTGTLAISNWNGASAGGGSDKVFFGSSATLTPAQLADITFVNGIVDGSSFSSDSAAQLADGELVAAAIPEPGAWAMMLAGAGVLFAYRRVRRRKIGYVLV
jgi:autotransporter-associated beta strand protein